MNVKQIRKLNLAAIISREKKASVVAEKVGTDAAYLSQIVGKKGKGQVGDDLASRIEKAYGMAPGDMDRPFFGESQLEQNVIDTLVADGWDVEKIYPRTPGLELPSDFKIGNETLWPDLLIRKGEITTYIEVKSPHLLHSNTPWRLLESTGKVGIITSASPAEIRTEIKNHLAIRARAHSNVVEAPLGVNRVPLISYVQAGEMTEAVDPYAVGAADKYLLTDEDVSSSAFALIIKGRSMEPDFMEGDAVIIDPSVEPIPGDFVAAKNGEHEATFKKYRPRGINEKGEQVFELVPLNDDFPTMRSDLTPIKIIGTMVEHRKFRRKWAS